MENIFITDIKINEVRHLKDFEIKLSENERKHLIITGKNGSGKTSVLNELIGFLINIEKDRLNDYIEQVKILSNLKSQLEQLNTIGQNDTVGLKQHIRLKENWIASFGGTTIDFNNISSVSKLYQSGSFIIAFFSARRSFALKIPTGIQKINMKDAYIIEENVGNNFVQYLVNLKADKSFARDDDDLKTVKKIDEWFDDFKSNLFGLFDTDMIDLEFDRTSYNYNIIEKGKIPYNLNQLSDGYSAIFRIVSELIMRMEKHKTKSYDVQGVVLIDEVETHLHVELQKKILPFLTSFFPKIQFIVTTHSPFVISSIENAVICDLEKRIVTTDLSGYSYDTLIESYFGSDKYSLVLTEKIREYEELSVMDNLTDQQKDKLYDLKKYLNEIPKFISDELAVKLQQIRLKENNRKIQR